MIRAERRLLLVFGDASGLGALLGDLEARGFELLRAATEVEAEAALKAQPVRLAIACAETSSAAVDRLISAIERTRPGTPVLAIRDRSAPEAGFWRRLGVGILRKPLLPDALARSVEVVLGLKRKQS